MQTMEESLVLVVKEPYFGMRMDKVVYTLFHQ